MRIVAFSLVHMNRLNQNESSVFKYCRSLFLKVMFSQIIQSLCFFSILNQMANEGSEQELIQVICQT